MLSGVKMFKFVVSDHLFQWTLGQMYAIRDMSIAVYLMRQEKITKTHKTHMLCGTFIS